MGYGETFALANAEHDSAQRTATVSEDSVIFAAVRHAAANDIRADFIIKILHVVALIDYASHFILRIFL